MEMQKEVYDRHIVAGKGKLGSALVAAGSVDDSDTRDVRCHLRFRINCTFVSSTLTEINSN